MTQVRRWIIIPLIVVLALMCCSVKAVALNPCALSRNDLFVSIQLNNGNVIGTGRAYLKQGKSAKVTVQIQKQVNDSWVTVASGSGTTLKKIECTAVSNITYRVKATATFYDEDDQVIDIISRTSGSKTVGD